MSSSPPPKRLRKEIEPPNSIDQFSDDILTCIISFNMPAGGPREKDVALLFRRFGRVAIFSQDFCNRYVQRIPIIFDSVSKPSDYQKVAWMCKRAVKLKRFRNDADILDEVEADCMAHLLKCCDISELSRLRIQFLNEGIRESHDYERSLALEAGIPRNIRMSGDMKTVLKSFSGIIAGRMLSPFSFTVKCTLASFYLPLLAGVSRNVRCLHLQFTDIDSPEITKEGTQHEALGDLIAKNMPNLKRLDMRGYLLNSIKSKSIEDLAFDHVPKIECCCPSLTNLKMCINFQDVSDTYLSSFVHNIEKLTIQGFSPFHEDADMEEMLLRQHRLTDIIEKMSNLKKLKLHQFDFPFIIKSTSLQSISVSDCGDSFRITACICPSLQLLKCATFPDFRVAHVTPEPAETWHKVGRKKMKAVDCNFKGIIVPETCTLQFLPTLIYNNFDSFLL